MHFWQEHHRSHVDAGTLCLFVSLMVMLTLFTSLTFPIKVLPIDDSCLKQLLLQRLSNGDFLKIPCHPYLLLPSYCKEKLSPFTCLFIYLLFHIHVQRGFVDFTLWVTNNYYLLWCPNYFTFGQYIPLACPFILWEFSWFLTWKCILGLSHASPAPALELVVDFYKRS